MESSIFTNKFIIENLATVANAGMIAFIISFIVTPFVGKLAIKIKAVDLPASMRKKDDRSTASRINEVIKPKLGGLAIFAGFFITILLTNTARGLNNGIILGLFIIVFFAFLDDKFELPGKVQLIGQLLAALVVVLSGISITSIHIFDTRLSFDLFSAVISMGRFTYNFIFPADIITIFWIIGIINVVNWVGGVDALNPSITALAATTMLLLALNSNNIILATIIAAHVGALLGFIPYNYNPSKLIQGATGDFLNGYLLAIFAIIGGARWTATFILFGLPIIDALLVVYMRLKVHPEARKNPLKLLSISDTNHLHHRLLAVGYSRKTVLFIEMAMMTVLCMITIYFSGVRKDVTAVLLAIGFVFITFSLIFYLKQRSERARRSLEGIRAQERAKRSLVKVTVDGLEDKEEGEDYERFIY